MKKIGALILLAATLITACFTFTSCTNEVDIPEGMQLVHGGNEYGYYFFAPEEWTISNVGDIKSAYASRVDTTSVSLVEVAPESFLPDGKDADEYFFNSYFSDSLKDFKGEPKVSNPSGELVTFGKEGEGADKAKRYTYTYEYFDYTAGATVRFGFMQYLLKHDGRYYIFTYASSMENRTGSTESYYDYYLDKDGEEGKLTKIIKEFRFIEKTGEPEDTVKVKDADGYILASDPDLAGFCLYVPEGFEVDYSSAIVSATHSDGTNINMATTAGTNENVNAYMHRRLSELQAFAENIECEVMKDENGNTVVEETNSERAVLKYTKLDDFGGAITAYAYEYTYEINGEKYYVYQVIAIDGWLINYNGYVFTYTSKDTNKDLHSEELTKIIEKVKFE